MSMYRRLTVPGGTIFFTVCLARPGGRLLIDEIDLLRWSVGRTRAERPFEVLDWVVLPDQMHAIWRLPPGDCGYSIRWGSIKARFSLALREAGRSPALRSAAQAARGEAGIWQKRFWEHHIRDAEDLRRHLELCRSAPVQAGLVQRPEDWPFSFVQQRQAGLAGGLCVAGAR